MSLDAAGEERLRQVERLAKALAKAHADIVEYWEPKVRELKSKYASANSKIATLNGRIARLEAALYRGAPTPEAGGGDDTPLPPLTSTKSITSITSNRGQQC